MASFSLQSFSCDWLALGGSDGQCQPVYAVLDMHYGAESRQFHGRGHLIELFDAFDEVVHLAEEPASLRMAIWFHDILCEPGASDNERASAELWRRLAGDDIDIETRDRVASLILDTRHLLSPSCADGALLADIDLSGLAASPGVFDRQSAEVRAEFPPAEAAELARGHAAFLQALLERPAIYRTAHFRQSHEARARANLGRYLTG